MNDCQWGWRNCNGPQKPDCCYLCLTKDRDLLLLQVKDLQGIVDLCVQQGGLSFHVEGGKCPEDDTCDCTDALRVNKAMKGYEPTATVKRVGQNEKGQGDE